MASVEILGHVISELDKIRSLGHIKSGKAKVDVTILTKHVYDFTKGQSHRKTDALPELVTEGFDGEQIWQQLELQNENEIPYFCNEVSKVLVNSKKLLVPVSCTKPEPIEIENDDLDNEDEGMFDDRESEDERTESKSNLKERKHDAKKKSSIVDDKFFKLQELDEYLTKEEKKEKQKDGNDESDDESINLFLSEEEDEDDTEGKYVKYADFFDSPESENEQHNKSKNLNQNDSIKDFEEEESESEEMDDDEEDEEDQKVKRVRFNLTNDSDETDSLENKANQRKENKEEEMDIEMEEEDTESRSTLEARQKRLMMKIKELEDEAMGEKPWQLKGEVSGSNRPQNSLLEEYVDIDINTRPAPIITEETTMKLEDIIKQRIKDKAWDDVEKKFKPVETPLEYKKKLILNQEKSKESLSQIYEKEYLKQKQSLDPENNEKKEETSQLHGEIKTRMRSLISKLDALSNYHYTPKMVRFANFLKIKQNLYESNA